MRHSAGTWSGKTSEVPLVPVWAWIPGRSFRLKAQPETVSRFES